MNRITLQQISELPDKDQKRLKAVCNELCGQQYAAQKRRKRVMEARTKIEQGVENGK